MSAVWKMAKNWVRSSQEWIKTITGSRSKPTFPHSPSPCQLFCCTSCSDRNPMVTCPLTVVSRRVRRRVILHSGNFSACGNCGSSHSQLADGVLAASCWLCHALALPKCGTQMQKSQPSFPPGRSALAELLGRFFTNTAKGSWSHSAWFLKTLGHGSWNECLENRLVFSSPLVACVFGW